MLEKRWTGNKPLARTCTYSTRKKDGGLGKKPIRRMRRRRVWCQTGNVGGLVPFKKKETNMTGRVILKEGKGRKKKKSRLNSLEKRFQGGKSQAREIRKFVVRSSATLEDKSVTKENRGPH